MADRPFLTPKPGINPQAPLISVVIPAYNEERFLAPCLQSLKAQDFQGDFEVIVVDNNSSDRTADVARQHGAKVIFEPKRGVCAARQAGTKAASGQIVVSTDADTTFAPDWLSRIWENFSNDSKLVALAGPALFVNAPWWGKLYTTMVFGGVQILHRLTGKVFHISACNTAFRKSGWPGYNTNLTQGGDEFDLLMKLQRYGEVKFLPNNIVFTSSRRLRKGLLYSLFVTVLLYYVFDYSFGRITGKSLLGSYPAIRQDTVKKINKTWMVTRSAVFVTLVLLIYSIATHHALAQRLIKNTSHRLDSIEDRMPWRH